MVKYILGFTKPKTFRKWVKMLMDPGRSNQIFFESLEPSLFNLNLYQGQNKHYDFLPLLSTEEREKHTFVSTMDL